jgi:hypothetical protein
MITKKIANLMLERWIAELRTKDRTTANVGNNFDEIFSALYNAGISFDDAYALVDKAVKAHYPSASTARKVYKLKKYEWSTMDKTEREFIDDWNNSIKDIGLQVFYNYFQIEGDEAVKKKKTYGSMSQGEYLKQRKYIDAIPVLDVNTLPEFKPITEDIFDEFPEMDSDDDIDVDLGEV